MKRGLGSLGLALAALLSMQSVDARAEGAADVALARELFTQGVELAQAGRWAEARERYRRSLALKRAPLTLYSLGVAQQQTGELVEATESFRAFLAEREADSAATMPYEAPAREAIAAMEKRIARIHIAVSPPGASGVQLRVDGQLVPEAAFGLPRPVNPGQHTIVATAPGYRKAEATSRVAEGGADTVTLRLEPMPSAPKVARPSPPPPVHPLPVVLMANGSALFATGLGIGITGVAQAAAAPTRNGPNATNARALSLAGDVVGGVGIAVFSAGVILLLLPPKNPTQVQSAGGHVPLRPFVTASGVGLRF